MLALKKHQDSAAVAAEFVVHLVVASSGRSQANRAIPLAVDRSIDDLSQQPRYIM